MTNEEPVKESQTLSQKIARMNVAEKIKLALTGDKEARSILIRDGNKIVQTAVVQNARLTDAEAVQIAKMRTMDEGVIRHLATDRKWLKIYPVKVELAKNPKTPLMLAMKLLQLLREADLHQIAKSKDVLRAVSSQALRLLSQKKQ